MKIWEFEEGKIYKVSDEEDSFYKIENGICKVKFEEWEKSTAPINSLTILDFEEVVDTNSHWKPKCLYKTFVYIDRNFESVYSGDVVPNMYYPNVFNKEDAKKVECLALEFKIKSILLNWRRLHDDVKLDWSDYEINKWLITDGSHPVRFMYTNGSLYDSFGYFSTKEKAEQFYEYMKDEIDWYFQMRKELKF